MTASLTQLPACMRCHTSLYFSSIDHTSTTTTRAAPSTKPSTLQPNADTITQRTVHAQ